MDGMHGAGELAAIEVDLTIGKAEDHFVAGSGTAFLGASMVMEPTILRTGEAVHSPRKSSISEEKIKGI
jgi:hypothetical protein